MVREGDRGQAQVRAEAVKAAVDAAWTGEKQIQRDGLTLIFDRKPEFILNKRGEIVGVDAMVRLFNLDGDELPIDPHRIIINPPTVPRSSLTYEEGSIAEDGSFVGNGKIVAEKEAVEGLAYRRVIGMPDPAAAWEEAVWDSVSSVPNAKGWRTRGTVTTIFATAPGGNGSVAGFGAAGDYATARTTASGGAANHTVGQRLQGGDYTCWEACLIFDTSAITDTDVVSDVVLSCDGNSDSSTADFNAIAASSSYNGGAVDTGDWISGASVGSQTTYASWNSSGYSTTYNAFTSAGAAFNSAINKTGNTPLMLYSDQHSAGNAPAAGEFVIFNDADAAGTTVDPKLDITHAAGGGTTHPGWYGQKGGWW